MTHGGATAHKAGFVLGTVHLLAVAAVESGVAGGVHQYAVAFGGNVKGNRGVAVAGVRSRVGIGPQQLFLRCLAEGFQLQSQPVNILARLQGQFQCQGAAGHGLPDVGLCEGRRTVGQGVKRFIPDIGAQQGHGGVAFRRPYGQAVNTAGQFFHKQILSFPDFISAAGR